MKPRFYFLALCACVMTLCGAVYAIAQEASQPTVPLCWCDVIAEGPQQAGRWGFPSGHIVLLHESAQGRTTLRRWPTPDCPHMSHYYDILRRCAAVIDILVEHEVCGQPSNP